MDKREITEIGVKLIAFFTLIKPTTILIGIILGALIGGLQNSRELMFSTISALIPIVLAVIFIRKTGWIVNRLYGK